MYDGKFKMLRSKQNHDKVTGVIFLDLKKAFGTVNHELLIRKLKNLGVLGKSLIGRTQQTVCGHGDAVPSKVKVPIEIPQGSTLGPLLFLIHANGVESVLQFSRMTMFAEDIAFYCSDTTRHNLQFKLNQDLRSISGWLQEHRLMLNIQKSRFMTVGNKSRLQNSTDMQLLVEQDSLNENVTEFNYSY